MSVVHGQCSPINIKLMWNGSIYKIITHIYKIITSTYKIITSHLKNWCETPQWSLTALFVTGFFFVIAVAVLVSAGGGRQHPAWRAKASPLEPLRASIEPSSSEHRPEHSRILPKSGRPLQTSTHLQAVSSASTGLVLACPTGQSIQNVFELAFFFSFNCEKW